MRSVSLLIALICIAPVIALGAMAIATGDWNIHPTIARFLPDYILNSFIIAFGTGLLSLLIGSYAAWYISRYEFPFRRQLEWALLLPLAMPAYLLALVYGHLLDVAGPVQDNWRLVSGLSVDEYWFPDIRSAGGAIFILSFSLYPYVYLLARHAFSQQCRSHFDAAWLSGLSPRRWLWQIAIPIARPALAVGVALVMMEALADFGVVSLFGVPSFTTGIYRAWYGLGLPYEAAKLAMLLLLIVMAIVGLERFSRRRMKRSVMEKTSQASLRFTVSCTARWFYSSACFFPVLVGFIIPLLQLIYWAGLSPMNWLDPLHWRAAFHGVLVAVLAALFAVAIASLFAYRLRSNPPAWQAGLIRLATIGYAIPGSVIAVAIFIPLLQIDKTIADAFEGFGFERPGLFITGSIAAMVIACSIRFLAIAMAGMESGLGLISRSIDDAAQLHGVQGATMARELHWPHLKPVVLAAGFMVFADTLKELPASLLLRPFDVSTLAIRSYELASDSRLIDASVPALMMVMIGLIAVSVLIYIRRLGRNTANVTIRPLAGLAKPQSAG